MSHITKIVTIDGPAGAGKTSSAKFLASRLDGFYYLDTGAVYRTIAYALDRAGFSPADFQDRRNACLEAAMRAALSIEYDKNTREQRMYLNGTHIEDPLLRSDLMSELSSVCSEDPAIREYANEAIRMAVRGMNLIAEGRDTGSKLFPDAGLKFYLWARRDARAERRLRQAGKDLMRMPVSESQGLIRKASEEIGIRDRRDAGRRHAPLTVPDGAFWIDTTGMPEETVWMLLLGAAEARYVSARVI